MKRYRWVAAAVIVLGLIVVLAYRFGFLLPEVARPSEMTTGTTNTTGTTAAVPTSTQPPIHKHRP